MKVTLTITKKNLLAIKSGVKTSEWRQPSTFNKKRLLKFNEKTKKYDTKNPDVTELLLIAGYSKDAMRILVEVKEVHAWKFDKNVDIPNDNFSVTAGSNMIQIKLGKVLE